MDEGNVFSGNSQGQGMTSASPTSPSPSPSLSSAQPEIPPQPETPANMPGIFTPADPIISTPVDKDIIIKPPKQPRKWLVPVLIAVGALIIITVVAILLLANSKSTPVGTLDGTFAHYRTLLEYGPDNLATEDTERTEEGASSENNTENSDSDTANNSSREPIENSDDWFIFNVNEYGMTHDQSMAYYNDLISSYADFAELAASTDRARETLALYPNLLRTTADIVFLGDLSDQIITRTATDGSEKSYNYIQSILPAESDDSLISRSREQLEIYFTTQLTRAELYLDHGCLVDGELNQECWFNLLSESNDAVYAVVEKTMTSSDWLERHLRNLQESMTEQTNILEQEFGAKNENQ